MSLRWPGRVRMSLFTGIITCIFRRQSESGVQPQLQHIISSSLKIKAPHVIWSRPLDEFRVDSNGALAPRDPCQVASRQVTLFTKKCLAEVLRPLPKIQLLEFAQSKFLA